MGAAAFHQQAHALGPEVSVAPDLQGPAGFTLTL
jgi:hypothetical protein